MFEEFIKRENTIFDIIQKFLDSNLNFIIIGGYAVSSFKHRFSVDADVLIKKEDKDIFIDVLEKNGFKKSISKMLDNIYLSEFIRYEKKDKLPVNVDLLIGGMGMRQTNAALSFDTVAYNTIKTKIKGIEREVTVKIPTKELLIAMKIHAGRLTDFRDIAALMKNVDLEKIKEFLNIGDKNIVKENIKKLLNTINKKDFIDSFKGVFIEKKFDIDLEEVKKLANII